MDAKAALENVKDSSKKGVQKLMRDDGNKAMDSSNEQRVSLSLSLSLSLSVMCVSGHVCM